ncbi:MAG TPA: hypothetical protein VKZ79_00215 [Alphaproteobacteria bacterium]|nr:hypothetical protein [Alphaproteobacteria bacterium]
MPLDVRKISFSRDEVVWAILELSHANIAPLAPGKIVGIEFGAMADVTVTLTIRKNSAAPAVIVTLPSVAIAAALILYCVNRNIPLPARVPKRIERFGDGICLIAEQKIKPRQVQSRECNSYIPRNVPLPLESWARPSRY